ncbi:chromate transporter [Mesorhizobium loti]|nr:chromate efflux transporter [Mesorhizobium loti]PLP58398.1 chromate transporter [Mesorhizobium loti]
MVAGENDEVSGSRIAEVFRAFLHLGLTSFGGPIAHLGYFRDAFVVRRKWIDEAGYADLVALCQFLPGPASSQVGFSLGVLRGGGLAGGIAAWAGFTLPSAVLLVAFAFGAAALDNPTGQGILHGLKLVAVAVVAQALWGMARTLTPDRQRIAIALGALLLASFVGGWLGQVGAIAAGAVAGLYFCQNEAGKASLHPAFPVSRSAGIAALVLFAVLLVLPSLLFAWTGSHALAFFDAFYRSGALVFGGGHVVLPLLENAVAAPGWVPVQDFLAGYGAAQAVPGPLFTFAAYLGAVSGIVPSGLLGATVALVAIFLPGLLLVYGTLPFWDELRALPRAQAAMRGTNAAVVGILAAAFYDPVLTSAIVDPLDVMLGLGGFLLLVFAKAPPWVVVILLAAAGAVV